MIVLIIALFVSGTWIALRSRVLTAMENIVTNSKTSTSNLPEQNGGINVLDPEDFPEEVKKLLMEATYRDLYSAEELKALKAVMNSRKAA